MSKEAEAQRIAQVMSQKIQIETLTMARLLVSKSDAEFFGKTEFDVRDRSHAIGACAIETALAERKKRGTSGRARLARTAANRPAS